MFRSYWLAAIAFGLTLLAPQVHSQEAKQPTLESQPIAKEGQSDGASGADDNAEDYSQLIERIVGELVGIERAIRDLEAEIGAPEGEEEKQRKDRDLKAQEDMVHWAMAMFWATVVTVVVAGFGIHYVRKTLIETRRLGKIQMRAYLSCEGGKFWLKEKMIVFEIYLTNRGQSPLFNGKFSGTLTFFGDKGGSRTHERLVGGFGSITAGGTGTCMIVTTYTDVDEGELEGQRSGVLRFHIIHARIKWKDVFGDDHSIDLSLPQDGDLETEVADGKKVLTGNLRAMTVSYHDAGERERNPTLHEKIRAVFGRRAD